jgi:hypothetical protein
MIRRWPIAVLGGYLAFAACGCSWAQSPKVLEIVAVVQTQQDAARAVVTQAAIAFEAAVAVLPADRRAEAQKAFDAAVLAYSKADVALTDLRKAVIASRQPAVDVGAVVRSLVDAVRGVIAIVEVITGEGPVGAPPGAKPHPALVEAYRGLARLEQ